MLEAWFVFIHFLLVPKPMLLTIPHTSHQDVGRSSSKGKSLHQARGRLSLGEIPGPRELCQPHRAHCPELAVGVSGRSLLQPAAQADMRRQGAHAVSQAGPRRAAGRARLPGQPWKSSRWCWVCPWPQPVGVLPGPSWPRWRLRWHPLASWGSQVPGLA